ncbi:nitronate monooxygenase [Jeotgalibacillus sp. ET6]|uniref:NAD(P)H-dependent flavin oxidoreductase n=1 Tax=Jeotgalibacillus sp. ET6 TaxID=3037260 RepID=UPI0024185732|nr:nitronate monooxygenase [Jeotgalibacillus sp. ET6]MDG5473047.1 nitronate monooxygenase [Jeotgalibacillus sp. ET6]
MNNLTRILGITYPIIQGGMGNVSNAPLAAAVSNAGGLGMIGAGTMEPEQVEDMIVDTKKRTSLPFGVNIALSVNDHAAELLELVGKHQIKIVSLSAGNPAPHIPMLKGHHCTVMTVAGTVAQAVKAEKAGADIVIGEGYEAAGINSPVETTTMALIPQMCRAISIPVAAAGGIGDGRGLAAALALGAFGVQMGTRFIATKESGVHANYISAIISSRDDGTLISGRTVGKVRRVLPTPYIKNVLQTEEKGMTVNEYLDATSEFHHISGAMEGRLEEGFLNGGQISGLIEDIPSVEDLIKTMVAEAKIFLSSAQKKLPI